MSVEDRHDPQVLRRILEQSGTCPTLPEPTDDELWMLCRVPRLKSAGSDAICPYLLYLLDRQRFHLVANCIRTIVHEGTFPAGFADVKLVGLYKGTGPWEATNAWRPISIPTALYRVDFCFIQRSLSQHFLDHISATQFGARGRNTAMATHSVLAQL